MSVPPAPSITVAPSGRGPCPAVTAVMRLPSVTTSPANGSRPVPSKILALLMTYALMGPPGRIVSGAWYTVALLVEPHVLQAPPAVDGVMRHEVLHVRPRREVVEAPAEYRAHGGRLEPALDLLHQRQPLRGVELL